MACPWCTQACFSPGSILSKLRSQPVQHAYSVANHPRREQTHLRLCVCVCLCKGAGVVFFFICKSNVFPIALFWQLLAGHQHKVTTNTQQLCTRQNLMVHTHTHTQAHACLACLLLSAEGVNCNFKNAPKDKTWSSRIPFSKSLKDMHGHLHTFLQ